MDDYDKESVDSEVERELYTQFYLQEAEYEDSQVVVEEIKTETIVKEKSAIIRIVTSDSDSEEEAQMIRDCSSPELNISHNRSDDKPLNRSSNFNSSNVCILCGKSGHSKKVCHEKYCFHCFAPGHLSRDCPLKNQLSESTCKRCKTPGHTDLICPEIWRQFKQTSLPNSPIVKDLHPSGKGCCFCGNTHHIADDCKKKIRKFDSISKIRIMKYDNLNVYKKCQQAINMIRKKILKCKRKDKKVQKATQRLSMISKKLKSSPAQSKTQLNNTISYSTPLRDSIKIVGKSTGDNESFISINNSKSSTANRTTDHVLGDNFDTDIFANPPNTTDRRKSMNKSYGKSPRKSYRKRRSSIRTNDNTWLKV